MIAGIILDWLIRQVICKSLKGSCVHQQPEQGHLAISLFVWVNWLVDYSDITDPVQAVQALESDCLGLNPGSSA